ncbi:FecCD family ABC transporter permease [Thiomicrorhabdus arctica]|uniref:FecCD family ABC transporter permease n=1 Tax=Thiomicrorhabdus arctica TaxID=131540 RepID=UPI002481210A|nr:iron ABC transporter permease [Thiomicrorhabdus arctica]
MISMLLSLFSGDMSLSAWDLLAGLSPQQSLILWEIRLPRTLMTAIVGAGLAISGVALQALFRNPLAEPGLIGVSSSAAFGAVLVIVLGGVVWQDVSVWQMSLSAFIAAALSTALLYSIATRNGHTDVALMLLAGVAFNAVAGALTQLLITFSDDSQLRSVLFWMMGSFANLSWASVGIVLSLVLVSLIGLWRLVKPMNAFVLGENVCIQMGYEPKWFKWQVMGFSALMVGAAVSVVGVIGFVGLVVPHIMRLLIGSDHRLVLPLSALAGAILLVVADLFARQILYPAELPIGLLMALLGGPFFLMLLLNKRRRI